MASDPQPDDDLSPQDFLRRVREMTEERDREDRQRVTDIEKDILQSREQRRARRADHARSLSNAPIEKVLPLSTPVISTTSLVTPPDQSTKSPAHAESPTTLARSGTLSWQQRRRPLSQIALENNRLQQHTSPEPTPSSPEKEHIRADIAQSLAAKDPSWFRQTADRGLGSAALRRTPEPEAVQEAFKMPGMETRVTGEPLASPSPDTNRSNSPSRAGSSRESEPWSNRHSAATSVSDAGLPSLRTSSVYDAPVLTPPREDVASPVSSGRMSPTKGMGGFVQSAMMKRSDSVNKRWSTTATPGLQRAGSTASIRGGLSGRGESTKSPGVVNTTSKPHPDNRLSGLATVHSLEPSSRPSSTYSNYTITQNTDEDKGVAAERSTPMQSSAGNSHNRSKSMASLLTRIDTDDTKSAVASPPASPSKRWSPTKSTWLESKLSQPEEKVKATPPPPSQPSWMADIAKAKQQRISVAIDKAPELSSISVEELPKASESSANNQEPLKLTKSAPEKSPKAQMSDTKAAERPLPLRKTSATSAPKIAPKPALTSAEVGKIDFRAKLKSRAPPPPKQTETPEFQNAFGKLRRANTEKFVAPDELKNNILRGKAGLAQTGGPAKREKVDELKNSLLKRKEEMKAKISTETKRPEKPKEVIKPEALAMGQKMNKVELPKGSGNLEDRISKPSLPSKADQTSLNRSLPTKAVEEGGRPSTVRNDSKPIDGSASIMKSSTDTVQSEATKSRQPAAGGKLANKINPALSNILARGPPGMGPSPISKAGASSPSTAEPPQGSRDLTHMTKGRARGPKRRAPKTVEATADSSAEPKTAFLQTVPSSSLEQARANVSQTTTSELPEDTKTMAEPLAPKAKFGLPLNPRANLRNQPTRAVEERPEESIILINDTKPDAASEEQAMKPQKPAKSLSIAPLKSTSESARPVTPPKPLASRPISELQDLELSLDKSQASPNKLAAAKFGAFNFGLDAFDIEAGSPAISPEPFKSEFDKPESLKRQSTKIVHLDLRTPVSSQPGSPARSPTRSPGQISVREAIAREVVHPSVAPLNSGKTLSRPESPIRSPVAVSVREAVAKEVITPSSGSFDFAKPVSRPASPTKAPIAVSVRDAASRWSMNSAKTGSYNRVKSPLKLPTQEDEDKATREAGLMPSPSEPKARSPKPPTGLGLGNIGSPADTMQASDRISNSIFPISPPISAGLASTPTFTISPAIRSRPNSTQQDFSSPASPIKRSRPPSMTIRVPPPDSPGSPIPHTSEAARMFSEVFDDQPRISGSTTVDVLTVIENYPLSKDKIETIKSQMQELGQDGQLIPMAPGRGHILFEDSMYVCVHIFRTAKGSRNTEIYFWSGHNVVPADALMFARNVARANTGKFIPITQGKEPPAFFQALGGIVITFRGSKTKKRESTGLPEKFMLCGRKHLGHIAFDEVDFARSSFCSGFPFLISEKKKLYLWRGLGASADELGCARLIAMDIGLTPDVQEIAEGEEPVSFLDIFPSNPAIKARSPGIPPSATHWRLKASLGDKYRTRLFRVTQEAVVPPRKNSAFQVSNIFGGWASTAASLLPPALSPSTPTFPSPSSVSTLQSPFTESSEKKSFSLLGANTNPSTPKSPGPQSEVACNVDEIVPFCREDLLGDGVWVLDAFFEVYIILSPLSHSQNHAFSAALLFAQDYVILAASVEDRPFIPVSTVVLEGAPKDMKAVFRRWTDGTNSRTSPALPTSKLMAGKPLRRGGSMRVVGLAAALAAIQR